MLSVMPRTRFDRDYYAAMGLRAEATEDEIRRTYRRLALKWHPDRNPGNAGAEERFKEISEAYAVLIDPTKRRAYDAARRVGAGGQFHHTRDDLFRDLFSDPRASAIFEDLAREFARAGMRVSRHDFEQTLFGGRTTVSGHVFVVTPFTPLLAAARLARVLLRGARPPAPAVPRAETTSLPRPRGFLRLLGKATGRLLGLGSAAPAPPASAPGALVVPLRLGAAEAARGGPRRVTIDRGHTRDEVMVTVPAGVRSGTRLRLRGKGHPGRDGAVGDAYLIVEVDGSR